MKTIDKIKQCFEEARKILPEVTDDMLYGHGEIYYQNYNDGTDFDWIANDRLCEFFMFYKKSEWGFVKLTVNRDDTIQCWVYTDDEECISPYATLDKVKLEKGEAQEFCAQMYSLADEKGLYDKPISIFDFDRPYETNYSFLTGEEEDEYEFELV